MKLVRVFFNRCIGIYSKKFIFIQMESLETAQSYFNTNKINPDDLSREARVPKALHEYVLEASVVL